MDRSKEHILPQWLLRLTGDPKRRVILGNRKRGKIDNIRMFAFDQFTFPACEKCNNEYSDLEGKARDIVQRIIDRDELSEIQCDVFLDWLDKVRVGLWLGNRYLSENISDIDPNFHVKDRISKADRMAWIMRDNLTNGLNVIGTLTPLFSIMPSVFGLRINDLLILSASTDLMISRPLGFPFAKKRWTRFGEKGISIDFSDGTGKIVKPIFQTPSRLSALKIYQPIFSKFVEIESKYDCEYVRHNSLDWKSGKGRIFVDGIDGLKVGGIKKSDHLLSEGLLSDKRHFQFGANVIEVQNSLVWTLPSLILLPPKIRKYEAKRYRFTYGYNRELIKAYLSGRVVNSQEEVDQINAGKSTSHGA